MYSESHTKNVLIDEKKKVNNELNGLKQDNAQSDRVIKQAKTFTAKREKVMKDMREESDALHKELTGQNDHILAKAWKIDQEKRKLADKNLLKRYTMENMDLKQQSAMADININTAKARLEDLEGQKKMAQAQIKDVLTEKRKVDKENTEMEHHIQGKGQSEQEQKLLQFEAEREQTNRLQHSLAFKTEESQRLQEQLKEEEAKAKDMLDAKITAEQEMEILREDASAMASKRAANRDDLIRHQIKLSQLRANNERTAKELAAKKIENEALLKSNADLDAKNTKLDAAIVELVQRIDLNTLLREVDLEEMKLLAQNNTHMNMAFMQMMTKWEAIAAGKME